jgi:hypothetical protein
MQHEIPQQIQIAEYEAQTTGRKTMGVFGNTRPIKENLKLIGDNRLRFWPRLLNPHSGELEPGWLFPLKPEYIIENLNTYVRTGRVIPALRSEALDLMDVDLAAIQDKEEMTPEDVELVLGHVRSLRQHCAD